MLESMSPVLANSHVSGQECDAGALLGDQDQPDHLITGSSSQLCSTLLPPRTHLTVAAMDGGSVRIMDQPAQWQSGILTAMRVCVWGGCKCVHNHFSPEIHQSNTRSHSLLRNNLLLSSSLPVRPITSSLQPPLHHLLSGFVLRPPWMNGLKGG